MRREVSAGGVVLREREGRYEVAVIRPRGRRLWALPKGHLDGVESARDAAEREVREETGLTVSFIAALGPIHYRYAFRGVLIDKTVHFFLFRYLEGTIDTLEATWRVEVDEARWIRLEDAPRLLGYALEREVAGRALKRLQQVGLTPDPDPDPEPESGN